MLREITIENVAVIERATAVFDDGLTILTGETGAGKSILIDSINAILGERTSRDLVRSGAAKASIWARFENVSLEMAAHLEKAGYPLEDGELLLYREISSEGKSNCRINSLPATAAMLRDVCGGLVQIHGQHDNHSLLNSAKHLGVLDTFAQNGALKKLYEGKYSAYVALQKEITALDINESEKNRQLALLQYETEEISVAGLVPGEEEQLETRRNAMRHAQTILDALNSAYNALSGDDEEAGASVLLGEAARQAEAAARYEPGLSGYADTLNELYYTASEVASDIQNRLSSADWEGGSIDEVEQRLDLIFRLRQKYGGSVEDVLAYCEKAQQKIESITFSAERLEQLAGQRQQLLQELGELADKLTTARLEAFERLREEIARALDFLNMPGIVLALRHKKTALGPWGQDELEFTISTNPGEQPKPLAKIASGGELARIMLAIKSALAERDDTATVIYDEVDTGISGLAAGRIGRLLSKTSRGRQVICVTHTAQIAAYADAHLLIEKNVQEGRTFTHIRPLELSFREEELARIISGDHITDTARANAKEMLALATETKKTMA